MDHSNLPKGFKFVLIIMYYLVENLLSMHEVNVYENIICHFYWINILFPILQNLVIF